jgi:hypothetical protein
MWHLKRLPECHLAEQIFPRPRWRFAIDKGSAIDSMMLAHQLQHTSWLFRAVRHATVRSQLGHEKADWTLEVSHRLN